MNTRELGQKNEKRVLREIKKFPIVDGYYVVSYTEIAKKLGINPVVVRDTVKRLEKKELIEVKQSYALFGSMFKRGIKILKEKNVSKSA